eukprot:scaffold579_cov546-Prasinococcus_capsulatus_cf.AAC.3
MVLIYVQTDGVFPTVGAEELRPLPLAKPGTFPHSERQGKVEEGPASSVAGAEELRAALEA